MGKLSSDEVKAITKPGTHPVGENLYIQVRGPTQRSWLFRYQINGKPRWHGLGSCRDITLSKARAAADAKRVEVRTGKVDIVGRKQTAKAEAKEDKKLDVRFDAFARKFIADHRASWRNGKHADQWLSTMVTYVFPEIGTRRVSDVDTDAIIKCLRPIWSTKTETAKRVRGRVEQILSAAKVEGLRTGDNPAQWRGHLDQLLAAPSKIAPVVHHPSMPYRLLPGFMGKLRDVEPTAARALEFAILCASRTGEVLGAKWAEIDLPARTWTIPADRMKARKEHIVPLSDAAVAVLKRVSAERQGDYVFPSMGRDRPMSDMAMLTLLRRMEVAGATPHGFRSSFRDWAGDETDYDTETIEFALAHGVSDKTERAYRRGRAIEKRRGLMQTWADHIVNGRCLPLEPEPLT